MCMGWVYVRATHTTVEHFLPRFLRRLVNIGDDQRAFNLALKGMRLTWSAPPYKRESFRRVVVGHTKQLQVVLLPNNVIRRFGCTPEAIKGSEVAVHCRGVGDTPMMQKETAATKAGGLRQLGLWKVRDDATAVHSAPAIRAPPWSRWRSALKDHYCVL